MFGSGHEDVLTSTLREDPDDPHHEHTQSTHEHFYPGSGRPLANDPTSCFGGLYGVDLGYKVVISQVSGGRFEQLLYLPILPHSTPVAGEVAASGLSSPSASNQLPFASVLTSNDPLSTLLMYLP